MDSNTFNEKMFDAMLEMACHEVMEQRLAELPPEDEIAHEFSPEFERKMNKLIYTHTKKLRQKKFFSALKKSAVAVMILMAVGFTSIMSVAALRADVINTFIEIGENFFGFRFGQTGSSQTQSDSIIRPTYIPEGFRELSSSNWGAGIRIRYEDSDGARILFDQSLKIEGTVIQIDNEHSVPYSIEYNGYTVQVFDGTEQGYECYVIWETGTTFFKIMSEYPADELILMAKSIIEQLQ